MAGYEKYVVSAQHISGYEPKNRKVIYNRVIGLYDTFDEAIDKFVELVRAEPYSRETDIKDAIFELKDQETEDNFEKNGEYNWVFETMHDWPTFYIGPGAYTIDKRRLQ